MRSLYLATFPQIHEDILECQIRFSGPFLEGSQVLGVLGQAQFNGVVHKIGDGSVRLGRLEAKASVDLRVEIHGRSLNGGFHAYTITL